MTPLAIVIPIWARWRKLLRLNIKTGDIDDKIFNGVYRALFL
jgi:hypothetical protein